MKVLMQSRKNFFDLRGGDTVQLEKTKAELEKLGVEVDFSLEFEPDLSKYDLVHLSNVTRIQETYLHVLNAKAGQAHRFVYNLLAYGRIRKEWTDRFEEIHQLAFEY